jgi:hypothetical protein
MKYGTTQRKTKQMKTKQNKEQFIHRFLGGSTWSQSFCYEQSLHLLLLLLLCQLQQ